MSRRFYFLAVCACLAPLAASTDIRAQDTTAAAPGVRLGLSYPRGTIPRVIVLPVDSTPGDSVRAIVQRDLDYSDRVSPILLDASTLAGITPPAGQDPNYELFRTLGAAAIIQPKRAANGGLRVALYDVAAKRRVEARDFPVTLVPPVRDAAIRDSITAETTLREKAIKDSVTRVLRTRAAIMRRPPVRKDPRPRRFVVRDSLRRDSAVTAYIRRGQTRWEDERRDSVGLAISTAAEKLIRADSQARVAAADNERMSIHKVSDEVESWITGKRGIAATRIAYVHNGLIRVVDSDGQNDRAVTRTMAGRGTAMSPAWHPNGRRMVYSRMSNAGTQIEQLDLETGSARSMSPTGLNITPVFSQDGRNIVYASGDESGTDLMMVSADAADGVLAPQRLTFGRGSDNNSPSFSPDGRQIAFISGRSRFPEVYTMDADGTNVQLLTPFIPGVRTYRTAPDWSPDGRTVAYEQQNGDFQVWMINIRDKEPRRLTSEGENEGPSWAPDGRHLVLSSTRGGSKQIWVLDTESGRFRQLTYNAGARLPSWSSMLNPK
jgi:tol-pal system beta propeller repeat protein TolB